MAGVVSRWSEEWAAHEESAFASGCNNGWDSANFAEAYGRQDETFLQEGIRRGNALFLRGDERRAWLLGWCIGGIHFGQGNYADGTPVGAEIEEMTGGQPGRSEL